VSIEYFGIQDEQIPFFEVQRLKKEKYSEEEYQERIKNIVKKIKRIETRMIKTNALVKNINGDMK